MENERRIHNRRKYLQNIQWAKDEYPEYLKNSYISIREKKSSTRIGKCISQKRKHRWLINNVRKIFNIIVMIQMQIKTMRHHFLPSRLARKVF